MRIGVIGSGRIGGNLGTLLARAGHEVVFSFSRDPEKLRALSEAAGGAARAGTPREAAEGDAVVLSVPWNAIDRALSEAGPLEGRVVVDTTNPFTERGLEKPEGATSARFNQRRAPRALWVKAFNTLTAGFQEASAGRSGADRVVMFFAADDDRAAGLAVRLIHDAGFSPAQVGGLDDSELMEAPRREGAVYGEEYHPPQAATVVNLWRARRPEARPEPGPTFVQRYIRAFGTADYEALREIYDEDVRFYTPLAWGAQGWEFLRSFIQEFHRGYPGLKVTLHDEFYSAGGDRACFRFVLHWHHAGPFFGHAPTGERGTMSETHAIRLRNGRIVEQWVGDNSFQMPHQELVTFGMDFPRETPDPAPPTLTVEAPSAAPAEAPSTAAP
jgi:predicted dinucleotide-binding enzyme/predicted ester cyclase